jgi:hypothetical protein
VTTSSAAPTSTANATQTLATVQLPGGHYTIAAHPYEIEGHKHIGLTADVHPSEPGVRPSYGRGRTSGVEQGVLALDIESGCLGHHTFTIAYGLLRDPRDSVSAEEPGRTVSFKKVAIPPSFGVTGAVVHTPLSGPAKIVVRAPNGNVVSSEQYRAVERPGCHG